MSEKAPRKVRSLRIGAGGIASVQVIAEREAISWDEAARRLLAYGAWKMPADWRPGKAT